MSYIYEKAGKSEWRVKEKNTDLVMIDGIGRNRAKDIARSLNLGSGFKGKTPEFFCYKYNTQKGNPQKRIPHQ